MRLIEWVRKNREEIDYVIKHTAGNIKITDEERRLWVLNDEGLYRMAKKEIKGL